MKKIILAVAVAALALMAVAAPAFAGVERYQMQSMTITAQQPENEYKQWGTVWTHTYNVTLNPCDRSFSGTGSQVGTLGGLQTTTQSVTGQLDGNNVSLSAKRSDGISWTMSGLVTETLNATVSDADGNVIDTTANPIEFRLTKSTPIATTNYKNHGEYVKAMGGGADAAHSCIGMPIK